MPTPPRLWGRTTNDYTLASLRYDISKLRAKGLIVRLDKSRRYRLTSDGYCICVVYLKLFEKIYAPLTSAILKPHSCLMRPFKRPLCLTGFIPRSSKLSIFLSMLSDSKSLEVTHGCYKNRILVRIRIND